ncbi:MAG: hypothetical protein ACRD0K_14495 [Egibacteraceae bacterium]
MSYWFSVHVEAQGPDDAEPLDALDGRLDLLLDALAPVSGVVGGAGLRWDAQVSVSAEHAPGAIECAVDLITSAASEVGLPAWPVFRVEAVEEHTLEDELSASNFPDLVGVAEAAQLLGVSKQRVSTMAREHRSFPRPMVELAAGPVWLRGAIESFRDQRTRLPISSPAAEAS